MDMRLVQWTVIGAFALALPAVASAQGTTQTTTTTTVQTSGKDYNSSSHWTASGFIGSNFGAATNSASFDFGGQLAYLWGGWAGAEFLADFAPTFKMNNALLSDNPNVNSYMANAIIAVPIGDETRIQPYVSGGLGGIQMRADVLNVPVRPSSGFTYSNQTRFGGDIGAGIMGFAGPIGLRADVRYYRAFSTSNDVTNTLSSPANNAADVFTKN